MRLNFSRTGLLTALTVTSLFAGANTCGAVGGSLTLVAEEEEGLAPTITRMEIWRGNIAGKKMPIRQTVPAGVGFVLDRQTVLTLPDGPYSFRMIRGPEYRIVTGNFTLDSTSLDDHSVQLPRIINMLGKGWTSGDCCVVASPNSLPLRMASEDLHMATSLGDSLAKPIPHRKSDDAIGNEPIWIRTDAAHRDGLVFYGMNESDLDDNKLPVEQIVSVDKQSETKIAIENPFAWQLPVWLASQRIDGAFVFGDWLRLDRKVMTVKNGRAPQNSLGGGQAVGRWSETIYRNMLDAGFRMPPLAGGGSDSANTPVGYNRLYVGEPLDSYSTGQSQQQTKQDVRAVESADEWWSAAWRGHSVATNGPLLRPKLDGKIPGHVFTATQGDVLQLRPELSLSVRDKVEYLEVIHNNRVDYSARLDEFAKAGGILPKIEITESGWVVIRVITHHEDHYRAALSAPWYIDFDGQPRVGKEAVEFFQQWLEAYEKRLKRLPPVELQRHAPFVRGARKFWNAKSTVATD